MKNVAVLVSGGGTNLQALIDAAARGEMPNARLALVSSSKSGVLALERAENACIPTGILSLRDFPSHKDYDKALLETLCAHQIDLVVLAGFLTILGPLVLGAYKNRIVNVHPSLIPSFCGDGYYGLRPHREALARGVKLTGATVHLVDEVTDGGRILLQKAVEVLPGDTPEILQRRVMEQAEWILLPKAVQELCRELDESGF